jgi:threonine/homoserine/homoserine lactone efflux protein
MNSLFEGIFLGFTLAVLLGPAFFTLIQTSIHRGLKAGLFLAIGIFFSDFCLMILCYLGASQLIYEGKNSLIFGTIGGIILVIYGIYTFRRKLHLENGDIVVKKPGAVTYILKGFFLNFANPFIWIFWMGVVVGVTSNYGVYSNQSFLFFSGLLGTTISTDFFKCFISHKIKQHLNPKVLIRVNHVVGIILIIFGIALIIRVLLNFAGLG